MADQLSALLQDIRVCRLCIDSPRDPPLPHEPRPVIRAQATARIAICGQAPGTRVHASGIPFNDPSGDRLRDWMGVTSEEFYDDTRIAIVPMGFCFPGLDAKGGDKPPRRECAPHWRPKVFEHLPRIELMLLVGLHAQRWHLRDAAKPGLTETVASWREMASRPGSPLRIPLPHPSWRNNAWIKKHPWFEAELLPFVRQSVRHALLPHCEIFQIAPVRPA